MAIWTTDGVIIVDGSGVIYDCEECPCGGGEECCSPLDESAMFWSPPWMYSTSLSEYCATAPCDDNVLHIQYQGTDMYMNNSYPAMFTLMYWKDNGDGTSCLGSAEWQVGGASTVNFLVTKYNESFEVVCSANLDIAAPTLTVNEVVACDDPTPDPTGGVLAACPFTTWPVTWPCGGYEEGYTISGTVDWECYDSEDCSGSPSDSGSCAGSGTLNYDGNNVCVWGGSGTMTGCFYHVPGVDVYFFFNDLRLTETGWQFNLSSGTHGISASKTGAFPEGNYSGDWTICYSGLCGSGKSGRIRLTSLTVSVPA